MTAALIVSTVDKERLDYLLDSMPADVASLHGALRTTLAQAQIVEPADMPPDVVTLNSRVYFTLDEPYEEVHLTLSLPKDIRYDGLFVSVLSPAGSALLGRRVGQCVGWTGAGGERCRLSILELVSQPERSGQLHRWKGFPDNCINAESRRVLLRTLREPRTTALTLAGPSLLFLALLLFTPGHLGLDLPGMLPVALFLAATLGASSIHLLPQRYWIYGVELTDDGFIYYSRLRKARRIRYSRIHRIVAEAMFDGYGDSVTVLRIASSDGDARIDESIQFNTDLLDELKRLPGFRHDAWRCSDLEPDSKLGFWRPKRSVILERACAA